MIDSLLRYNTNAPRYTSYPPANLFQEAKSTCEHEVINSVLSNSKREETVELEMDNEKTL